MMEYLIFCVYGKCDKKPEQWQCPAENKPDDCETPGPLYWAKEKPINGSSINAAYKRSEFLHDAHKSCKCQFNVVEV